MSLPEVIADLAVASCRTRGVARALAAELRSNAAHRAPVIDREAWVKKLEQLQSLTAAKKLRPSQEILDELRADRI